MIRIVHMSDIHLTENGRVIWETDTFDHFNRAINVVKQIRDVDAIIVTGDLSDDGTLWTYQYIDRIFASVGVATYCIPGNHDSIKTMLYEFKPAFLKFDTSVHIKGWKIILADSVIVEDFDSNKNKSRGYLTEECLYRIESEIEEGLPTIIAMHHPSQEPGGWLNRKLLENRNEFNAMIGVYPNVRLVLYGHTHNFNEFTQGTIKFVSSSSIGYAFDKDLPKFQIADGHEGFNIIEIENNNITILPIYI